MWKITGGKDTKSHSNCSSNVSEGVKLTTPTATALLSSEWGWVMSTELQYDDVYSKT